MIRNMIIGVLAYGVPLAALSIWSLIAVNDDNPNMLFFAALGLPLIAITAWLVARGVPRSIPGVLALLFVSPVAGLIAIAII